MLNFPVAPMKATLGSLPSERSDGEWAYEIKWDGYRTLAHLGPQGLRLQSSNSLDVTAKYPELAGLAGGVNATTAILDGELVVLDDNGRPRFELMQQHSTDVAFYIFDVLHIDGHDTVGLPYEQRRQLLDGLVDGGSHWMVPAHRIGGGQELLDATMAIDLEGIMAKRLGSTYLVGKRSPNWIKVKNRRRVEVIIGGYTLGTGTRASTFGSLLVGVRQEGSEALTFAGGVGTGFDQRTLDELLATMRALRVEACPFVQRPPNNYSRDATWIEPLLVAELEIAEFTNEGYVRHAAFIRLKP